MSINFSNNKASSSPKSTRIPRFILRIRRFVNYCISGVWDDPRQKMSVRIVKTINLSVNSFLDRGLQIKSMALTYSTVLALVPAIALLVAIGRGFGLQNSLMNELYYFFPSQHRAISTALKFVDSYLTEATQGVFVGVGLIVLLWTVVSLLSSIEDAFNSIWDVKAERPFYQKITDYIAICLIIPILMIVSSGVSIFMSTMIQDNLTLPFLTPFLNIALETVPFLLAALAFSLSFFFIPNTKVEFKYAAIAGSICAIAFQVLQMLFLNGQIYVSKYNAIYGSFAFLPLLLIWLQFSWMLLLAGCVLTYSLQNVFTFNFMGNADQISQRSWHAISLITMCVISQRFLAQESPLSPPDIASKYNLPIRILNRVIIKLREAKLVYLVKLNQNQTGISPAIEIDNLSLGRFFEIYDNTGEENLIPDFEEIYKDMLAVLRPLALKSYRDYDSILIKDIPIPSPKDIRDVLLADNKASGASARG